MIRKNKFFSYIFKIKKYIYAVFFVFLMTGSSAQALSIKQHPKTAVKTEEKKTKKTKKTKKNSGKKKTVNYSRLKSRA